MFACGLLVLAGCGAPGPEPTASPPDFAAYGAQAAALHGAWDAAGFTDPATLPFSGSAAFNGVMSLHLESIAGDLAVNGAVVLDVSFGSDSLSGSATAFAGQDGVAYSGSLTISGGVLDRAADPAVAYTFSANIDGTLSGGGDAFAVTADMDGDFLGAAHDAVAGPVAGFAQSALGTGYVFGDFIAAR